ncbi:hypothetical protein Pmani_027226 [Petrolisthes manimaculis]|uniref:Uncharacterized protein n=1 Tax=Petrolisthes manimaculis TaxID=1843537 RepID=A0AAE1TZA6_9EUCA|nr:hypothetical protein Pmani_027226 [Petrolisthes manimaculis]
MMVERGKMFGGFSSPSNLPPQPPPPPISQLHHLHHQSHNSTTTNLSTNLTPPTSLNLSTNLTPPPPTSLHHQQPHSISPPTPPPTSLLHHQPQNSTPSSSVSNLTPPLPTQHGNHFLFPRFIVRHKSPGI